VVKVLISAIGFQFVWWQLLVFVSRDQALLGCMISAAYLVFHLTVTARERWPRELQFILIFGLLGWLGDGLLVFLQLQHFAASSFVPLWMLFLWFNYMTSMHYSMAPFFSNLRWTLFVGFIFGPWTYLPCAKLGLMSMTSVFWVSLLQGFVWMAWIWIYRRLVLRKVFS
jgi:hypothetical protein